MTKELRNLLGMGFIHSRMMARISLGTRFCSLIPLPGYRLLYVTYTYGV